VEVIILCGGLGTRLREETGLRPKPMVEIGEKPILWHIMKLYAYYGFMNFILCLGYKGNIIKEYFYNYKILNNDFSIELGNSTKVEIHSNREENWRLILADTGEKALKGARIKKIERYINNELFMVTYGDGLADINISELVDFHKSHNKIGTVTGVKPPSRFGELIVEQNKVLHFSEKPQTSSGLINGGFFVFKKEFLNYLSKDDKCDFEYGALEKLSRDGELMVYEHKGQWMCMDTLRDVERLNNLWQTEKAFWKIWDC